MATPTRYGLYMSKRSTKKTHADAPRSTSSPPWTGTPFLELVHEFNERFIEQVAEMARSDDVLSAPEMVRSHRELWAGLDARACRCVSRCPFLLADIRFRNLTWWQRIQQHAAGHPESPPSAAPLFPAKPAIELTRDALIVAWSTARQDTHIAATLLAMSHEVARIVARLGLGQLRHITDHHHHHLRPRWEHLSSFWGRLLTAAHDDDGDALYALHLQAFQLADAGWDFAACGSGATA